jgi:polyhydroxyalkanoate synthesis regulator phasin
MPDIQAMFKEAWSQALVGLNNAEQEAEKVLAKVADAAGFSPDDVKKHAREFGERLTTQRKELERAIDDAVKRTASRFKLPTREEIDSLRQRIDVISARIDAMAKSKETQA